MTEQKLPFSQWNPIIAENFVKEWEGLSLKAYKCSAGTLTIGYGHTRGVRPGQVISLLQAERFLRDDLEDHAEDLAPYVTCRLTRGQYIALLDLAFNLGVPAVAKSHTLQYLNAGDLEKAKKGFLSFSKERQFNPDGSVKRKPDGTLDLKTNKGLLNRRTAEVELM